MHQDFTVFIVHRNSNNINNVNFFSIIQTCSIGKVDAAKSWNSGGMFVRDLSLLIVKFSL